MLSRILYFILFVFSGIYPLSASAENGKFCCRCSLVSDDRSIIERFELCSSAVIDCGDYDGLEVPFNNPEPGAFKSPQLMGSLAACKSSSSDRAEKWKPRAYEVPNASSYWLKSDRP